MSQEKAQEFILRVGTEKRFSGMFDHLKTENELQDIARSLGYDFTVEELQRAIVRIMDLEDADLDSVTGGAGTFGYGKVLSLANLVGIECAE